MLNTGIASTKLLSIITKSARSVEEVEELLVYLQSLPDIGRYFEGTTRERLLKMCQEFRCETVNAGVVLFNKGDFSDKFYLIVHGKVEIFNTSREGQVTFRTKIGNGKKLGELGIITSQLRSLSAVAVESTILLTLTSTQFRSYLQDGFYAELEVLKSCIERFIPTIDDYSNLQKTLIAYCLKTEHFIRGQVILHKGLISDNLYIIINGEASVVAESDESSKSILKLSSGSLFGEEGVFMSKPNMFKIVAESPRVSVFYMRKFDALKVMPTEIIKSIKHHYRFKIRNREFLATTKAKTLSSLPTFPKDIQPSFVWATPFARKNLKKLQFMRSCNSSISIDDPSFAIRKSMLMLYSDSSAPRIRKVTSVKRKTGSPKGLQLSIPREISNRSPELSRSSQRFPRKATHSRLIIK